MSTNFIDIRQQIANKLSGISGLHGVYTYEVGTPQDGKYPFAVVVPSGFEADFGDTIRNIRTYSFVVRVYQERTTIGFGNEKAERVIAEITDEILTAFDADTTLSGMVKMVRPLRGDLDYVDREMGDTRVAEFILDCVTVVPSS
jgi:hypothetical protein